MGTGSLYGALQQNPKIAGAALALLLFLVYWLRGKTHKQLNKRLSGATNADNDQTRWLHTPFGLFVKPIIGYYRDPLAADLSTISAYFLGNDRYHFVLPAPWPMRLLKFRYRLVKTLSPIPRPWIKWGGLKDPFLRLGKTIDGNKVKLTQQSLFLVLGAPDSGKSKVAYEMLEQLSAKKTKSDLTVIDITRSFPKRICERTGAKRITAVDDLLKFTKELTAENERRQGLLDRFDIDHAKNLPAKYKVKPLWMVIDEGHLLFDKNQNLKSPRGEAIKECADLINNIINTGRKTLISIVYLSQSGLKSETLISFKARTIITGYLSPSEAEAVAMPEANNPALKKGVFLLKSGETGPQCVIMTAYKRKDFDLDKPLDSLAESPAAAAAGEHAGKGDGVPGR